MIDPESPLAKIVRDLFSVGAVKDKRQSPDRRGFRLKSHETDPTLPLSPFFFNLRTPENPKSGPLTPALVQDIAVQMILQLNQHEVQFTKVAGVPNAGDPFAAVIARRLALPLVKLGKVSGSESRRVADITDGECGPDDIVLMVDDLITTAASKLEAIQVIEATGATVTDVAVFLDREQGGLEELLANEKILHRCTTAYDVFLQGQTEEIIDMQTYAEIVKYLTGSRISR
ncbi:MAG: phosphoribosyltransferase family protein [bacterium]|nr:phosphoribosyltransferase family protein [bacterium]